MFCFLASQKLNIQGVSLVIEKDGTRIDNAEELLLVKNDPIIMLEMGQMWTSEDCSSSVCTNLSTTTTLTVSSNDSEELDTYNLENVADQNLPLVIIDHNSEMCWRQFDIWKSIPEKIMGDLREGNYLILCSLLTQNSPLPIICKLKKVEVSSFQFQALYFWKTARITRRILFLFSHFLM